MKLWIDDVRPAPEGYVWCKSTHGACRNISCFTHEPDDRPIETDIELIDIDHDSGDFYSDGGDFIKVLEWMEYRYGSKINWNIRIHSMNPVGVANMRAIIERNGWKEVF